MTLRLDRYAPEWARGIVEDLDAGIPGHEAVANAAGALRYQADEAEQRAILADQHAALGMDREQDDLRGHVRAAEPLIGVVERICRRLDVDFFACRGYVSQSEQWAAGKRFAEYRERGQEVVVLHLGDHDPSGIDMTRDNDARLGMFAREDVIVRRLALNYDQIESFQPPPNPAKLSDSRYERYFTRYGDESWELDALDPNVIQELIGEAVIEYRDEDAWRVMTERECGAREQLADVTRRWGDVLAYLEADPS